MRMKPGACVAVLLGACTPFPGDDAVPLPSSLA